MLKLLAPVLMLVLALAALAEDAPEKNAEPITSIKDVLREVPEDERGLFVAPLDTDALKRLGESLTEKLKSRPVYIRRYTVHQSDTAKRDDAFIVGWYDKMQRVKNVNYQFHYSQKVEPGDKRLKVDEGDRFTLRAEIDAVRVFGNTHTNEVTIIVDVTGGGDHWD